MPIGLELLITNNNTNSRVVRKFAHFPIRIGRNSLNDLHIAEGFISQFHAVIELHQGNTLMLRDLGSRNGTRLGAGRAPANDPVALAPQNEFSIGPLAFKVRLAEVVEEPEPAPNSFPTITRVLNQPAAESALAKTLAFDESELNKIAEARRKLAEMERAQSAPPDDLADSFTLDLPGNPQLTAEMMRQQQLAAIALAGVRELAQFYLPGSPKLDSAEDITRFLSRMRDTLDVFLRCFIPLRDGYRQFASEMELNRQPQQAMPPAARAVESAQNEKELASRLLDLGENFGAAHHAVEGTFADLMIHQLALLNAIMRGVKSLLTELSPPAITHALDEAAKNGRTQGWTWGPWRFKELWRIYGSKHGDMDDGDKRVFAALFGRDFAAAYSQYRRDADPNDPNG